MARGRGWTLVILLLGILGASVYLIYGPLLKQEVARRVAEDVKGRQLTLDVGKSGAPDLKAAREQGVGPRYQLLTDGKETFLADLKEGRVWRYFHHTRAGGREEEGFLPLPIFFAGKKHYSAGEVEAPASPAEPRQP